MITALIADTFREIYARKVIVGIVIIEVVTIIIMALFLFSAGQQDEFREAARPIPALGDSTGAVAGIVQAVPHDTSLLGPDEPAPSNTARAATGGHRSSKTFETPMGNGPKLSQAASRNLSEMVKGEMGAFAAPTSVAVLFLGIFATAGIVPSMMEKGTIDLLLSKPLSRTTILFGRALGGLLALALNLAFFVLAIFTLFGAATGVWHLPFLIYAFAIPIFTFTVLYSGVIALNVVSEGWVLPMSLTYIHVIILSSFLYSREQMLYPLIDSAVFHRIIDGLYYLLPQTTDLIGAVPSSVFTSSIDHIAPFIQGAIFAVVMLGLAVWKFQRKDF